jgi:tripeptide aminopeptidase
MKADRPLRILMDLLRVEGVSGEERAVADAVRTMLVGAGCRSGWIRFDAASRRALGPGHEVGNLVVRIPGRTRAGRRLFSAHLDTVPLCRGAAPVRRGNRIVPRGETALGADNRTGVACLVNLVVEILERDRPRPPLTLLFTVSEETGLLGAKHASPARLGHPVMGFNIDSGDPAVLVTGATGAERWEAEVLGRAAHAGVHPEDGVSAVVIAGRAIHRLSARGYLGRVRKGRRLGTANVVIAEGGDATNVVPHRVLVRGESRSHDPSFRSAITAACRDAFREAAAGVRNRRGQAGRVRCGARRDYEAFHLDPSTPVVQSALSAAARTGLQASCRTVDGGLDANPLNAAGIPTVTLGAGQHGAHTVGEYADVKEFLAGCRLALALAESA